MRSDMLISFFRRPNKKNVMIWHIFSTCITDNAGLFKTPQMLTATLCKFVHEQKWANYYY